MLGWEPREHTEYTYDGDRLVSSVTWREPEWRPQDVTLALAAELVEAEVGPHGIPMSEAVDPANEFAFEGPKAPVTDFAARTLARAQDKYYKEWPNAERAGHIWRVKRKPLVASEQEPDGADG